MNGKKSIFTILTAVLVFCLTALNAGGENIRVYSAVQEGDIYQGEPFQYQIIIDGSDQPGKADVTPLQPWSPQSIRGQNISQTSITISNGRQSQNVVKRYVMIYQLTAAKTGVNRLPAVTVEIEGNKYQTNPVEVNILAPQTSDKIHLEMTLSDTKCYVGQPVIMTVNWYIQRDLVQNRSIGNFSFSVPAWLDEEDFIFEEAAEEQVSKDQLLQVNVNNAALVASQSPADYQGQNCVKVFFRKILIPKKEGTLQIPAAALSCEIATARSSRSRDPFDSMFDNVFSRREYKRFQAASQPAALEVRPLPEDGKPANFNGLVGRYSIQTSAQPTEVNVGDPITLTIQITGDLLKRVTTPDLNAIAPLAENFKIPADQSAPKVEGNQKIFTQTIRANHAEVTEIPGIPLSFFDVEEGKYVTVYSVPIPLKVSKTENVTAAQAEGISISPQTRKLEAVRQEIAANYEGPLLLVNAGFSPVRALTQPGFLVLWGGPPVLFLIMILIRLARRSDPARQAARRQAGAAGTAIAKLHRLKDLREADAKTFHSELAEILRAFIGDRYHRVSTSLTAQDCRGLLLENGQDSEAAERFGAILQTCEESRFAANAGDAVAIDPEEIKDLLKQLSKKSRK